MGSWAFRLLFLGAEQALSQADWVLGPSSATDQLCDLGHITALLQASISSSL